ncbi:MAG: putative LPS assembly protein LptD [bacterium]|nr:putative LPS assembly protein LptD [bacterium]
MSLARRIFFVLALAAGICLVMTAAGSRAFAGVWLQNPLDTEEHGIRLSGDKLTYSTPDHTYIIEGSAVVEGTGWTVRADRITFDPKDLVLNAESRVSIQDQTSTIHSEKLTLNLRNNTGTLFQGKLEFEPAPGEHGRLQVEGETIQRSSPVQYQINQGGFTTCSCPGKIPAPWKIGCRQADLTIGEYITFRNFVFRVYSVPVLYFPWLAYPVKTQRQTGFLIPHFYYSGRDGFQAEDSFFINISPSLDATLGAKVLTNRGLQGSGEFRYRLTPGFPEGYAGGKLEASYLGELFVDKAKRQDWYTLHFTHEHDLSPRDWAGVDVNAQTQSYQAEFGGNLQARSAQYSYSSGYWRNRGDRLLTVAEADYYVNNLPSTAPEIHRLPNLGLELVDFTIPKTPIRFNGPVSLISFTNLQNQMEVVPRFSVFPRVLIPFPLLGVAGFSGQAGLEDVAYWVRSEDADWRKVFTRADGTELAAGGGSFRHQAAFSGEAKVETGWERVFLRPNGSGFRHQLTAEAGFSQRTMIHQAQIPELDELDLIGDRRYLPYRLATELAYRSRPGATRGRLSLEAREFYDLQEGDFSDILSRLSLNWDSWQIRSSGIYNLHGKGLTDAGASASLPLVPGTLGAMIGYRKIKGFPDGPGRRDLNRVWLSDFLSSEYSRQDADDLSGSLSLSLFRHVSLGGTVTFSLKEKAFLEGSYSLSYLSICDCYLLNFQYTDRPGWHNDLFAVVISFTGLGGELKQP